MTNTEFQTKLEAMFAKHPIIAKSHPKSLNEFVYVLRVDGDVDYQVITNTGMCIPSVRKAFVPTTWLSKKVVSVEYEEEEYDGIKIPLIVVELED